MPDQLPDFVSGTDKIDLSADRRQSPGRPATTPSPMSARAPSPAWRASSASQVVGGQVHIYGDMDGDLVADLHIIAGGTQILVTDFIL